MEYLDNVREPAIADRRPPRSHNRPEGGHSLTAALRSETGIQATAFGLFIYTAQ